MGADFLNGNAIEQAYLSTILKWAARHDGVESIDKYMALHQLILMPINFGCISYQSSHGYVLHSLSKSPWNERFDWGEIFDKYGDGVYDTAAVGKTNSWFDGRWWNREKSGIYRYVLSGDLRDLSFRTFDKKQKREAYERQKGICVHCGKHFELEEMEADHITPWKEGGTTVAENCQMLCKNCNRIKVGK